MSEQNTIEKKVKYCKVPLEIEDIKEYFLNKNMYFYLDYANSSAQGNMFLSYVGNLEIPCEINFIGIGKESKFELLHEYMKSRSICALDSLALTAAQVLLCARKIDTTVFLQNPILTQAECEEYIVKYSDVVKRWSDFIASTQLFLLNSYPDLKQEFNFQDEFPRIDDAHYVGHNVINLFKVPAFMEMFFSVNPEGQQIFYFKQQFEEYMFKGKNLFEYYCVPENLMYLLMTEIAAGGLDSQGINELLNEKVNG